MKRSLILLAGLALVLILSGTSSAQGPFYLPQIPAGAITVDGNGDDWTFMPEDFILTPAVLHDTKGGEMPSPEDFDCAVYLGYTLPPDNRFYVYARISDDIYNSDNPDNGGSFKDDCMEIEWDADNSGGNYRAEKPHDIEAQQYGVHIREGMEPSEYVYSQSGLSPSWIWGPDEVQWAAQPPQMIVAWTAPEGTENVTYAYEVSMTVWDKLSTTGPDDAVRHVFAEGQTVGLNINFDDVDAQPDTRDNQIGPYGDAWTDADLMADFITVGPVAAVEPSSWGAVKAMFR